MYQVLRSILTFRFACCGRGAPHAIGYFPYVITLIRGMQKLKLKQRRLTHTLRFKTFLVKYPEYTGIGVQLLESYTVHAAVEVQVPAPTRLPQTVHIFVGRSQNIE